jgi:DNA-binding transcriptional MerR regulator
VLAAEAGVNLQTLRYYERRGLLPEPARRDSGYRVYGPDAVRIVRFVKRARETQRSAHEQHRRSFCAWHGGAPPTWRLTA